MADCSSLRVSFSLQYFSQIYKTNYKLWIVRNGVGRTGTFCAAYTCLQTLDAGLGIPSITEIIKHMRNERKYMVQDKVRWLKKTQKIIFIWCRLI